MILPWYCLGMYYCLLLVLFVYFLICFSTWTDGNNLLPHFLWASLSNHTDLMGITFSPIFFELVANHKCACIYNTRVLWIMNMQRIKNVYMHGILLFVPVPVSHTQSLGKDWHKWNRERERYPMVFCANKYIPCITTPHDVTSSWPHSSTHMHTAALSLWAFIVYHTPLLMCTFICHAW